MEQNLTRTREEWYVDYIEYRLYCGKKKLPNDFVRFFLNWCNRTYDDNAYLTQEMVDTWCAKRSTEGERSFASRTSAINLFLQYLNKRQEGPYNLIEQPLSLPPTEEPVLFSKEELINFFRAIDEFEFKEDCKLPYPRFQSKLKALITPVIFRLMYSNGIRPKEARFLECNDVDLEREVIYIREAKGYTQRLVALHPSMVKMLKQYNDLMSQEMPNRRVFFPNDHDQPRDAYYITTTFKKCWYKYNNHGADGDVVPYSLRHNYAVENIMSWDSDDDTIEEKMLVLSKSMGHKWIKETIYYFHLVPRFSDLMEEMALKYDNNDNYLKINDL